MGLEQWLTHRCKLRQYTKNEKQKRDFGSSAVYLCSHSTWLTRETACSVPVSRLAPQGHHTFPRTFSSSVPSLSELPNRYLRHVLFSRTKIYFLVVGEAKAPQHDVFGLIRGHILCLFTCCCVCFYFLMYWGMLVS